MATKFITVSTEIMRDENLNQSQKFILAEIEQLTMLEKGCIASNSHFSNLIGITKENVSRNLNDLEKKGYIHIEIVKGSRNHTRIVTLTTLVRPPYQNSKTPLLKQQESKENKPTNKTNNRSIESFNVLWNLYNHKRSKSEALKLYTSKKLKDVSDKDIELAIKRYLPTVEDKQFQKHFSTFLNSLSDWLEDYDEDIKDIPTGTIYIDGDIPTGTIYYEGDLPI